MTTFNLYVHVQKPEIWKAATINKVHMDITLFCE